MARFGCVWVVKIKQKDESWKGKVLLPGGWLQKFMLYTLAILLYFFLFLAQASACASLSRCFLPLDTSYTY
ncbi:hypothetical protein A3841_01165 [Pontibacter flavimaris]|uniref:Uncharacterized protein n=1 Tax=Pontibacter flavimaris TaxID=1797110 RepID=A0A1Q5PBK0_9BACT|nr:hypothetical protein A3841_01165 [Pontibacter flavimaris]